MSTPFSRIIQSASRSAVLVFVATLLLAQALWLALPAAYRENDSGDYLSFYEPVGRNLASGQGIVDTRGETATRYPPGYPLLLAIVFRLAHATGASVETATRLFHLLCAGLSSVLLLGLARLLWRPRPALIVALAWVTCPPAIWLTRQPSSELPFLVFFFGSALLFLCGLRHRAGQVPLLALAGAGAGYASLIRPLGAGLPLALALLIWIGRPGATIRRRLLLSLALLAGAVAAIGPWETHVWSRTRRWIPLSTGGAASLLDGWTYGVNEDKTFQARRSLPVDIVELMTAIRVRRGEFTSAAGAGTVLVQEALARPWAAVRLLALKMLRSWYGTDSGRFERVSPYVQVPYAAAIALGLQGAWRRRGARRRVALGIALVLVTFWGMTILVLSIARYMLPAIGLALLLLPGIPGPFKNARPEAA